MKQGQPFLAELNKPRSVQFLFLFFVGFFFFFLGGGLLFFVVFCFGLLLLLLFNFPWSLVHVGTHGPECYKKDPY